MGSVNKIATPGSVVLAKVAWLVGGRIVTIGAKSGNGPGKLVSWKSP